jgi:tetratricopeptide (TPR) repeat protein
MQLPKDNFPICARCKEKPAVERYVHNRIDEMVCAACFDRWSLEDVAVASLFQVEPLRREKKYDEALAYLDATMEANRYRDHDGYLAQTIAHERAITLFRAGRHAEAEQVYRAWAQLGFQDVSERWMNALGMAETLEALGRDEEALAALEDALGYEDPKYLPSVTSVLNELVRFSQKLARPVDPKWLRIAQALAVRYRLEMPVRDSPGEAILALTEMTRGRQPKRPSEWQEDEEAGKRSD